MVKIVLNFTATPSMPNAKRRRRRSIVACTASPTRVWVSASARTCIGWSNTSAITVPPDVRNASLVDALAVFNAMVKKGEFELFPADLSATAVADHLAQHAAAELGWRVAAQGERVAVDVRSGVAAEGKLLHGKLTKIINGALPPGSAGRNSYFPLGNGGHTPGEFLAAAVSGFAKNPQPKLPAGWTLAQAQKLADDVLAAESTRSTSSTARRGLSNANKNLDRRTREIRKRLRLIIEGVHGADSPAMLDYGIAVQGPHKSRGKKAAGDAKAPASLDSGTAG